MLIKLVQLIDKISSVRCFTFIQSVKYADDVTSLRIDCYASEDASQPIEQFRERVAVLMKRRHEVFQEV